MRRDNCTLADYEAWLEGECNKLTLEPGSSFVGPFTDALGAPDGPPWEANFAIIYPGGMYLSVRERYRQLSKREGGGGCLDEFSYHYGPCTETRDRDGFPKFSKKFELRIDIDHRFGRHIHYAGEDHILEERIAGLDFKKIDPFGFARAVERHRKNSKPLHEILRFTVMPAK